MKRLGLAIGVGVAVVVVAAVVIGLVVFRSGSTSSAAQKATDTFLADWGRGDIAAMAAGLDNPPPNLDSLTTSLTQSAPGSTTTLTTTSVKTDGDKATAVYRAHVDVAGFGPLEWDGQLTLVKANDQWHVRWAPDVLYPGLTEGQRIVLHKTWPTRAPIVDAAGDPLVSDQPGVAVGLEPDRIKNLDDVKSTFSELVNVDAATVDRALAQPWVQPTYFVPIVTLPNDRYDNLRPQLAPVPGILFQRTHGRFALEDGIATQVLGRVGEITKERLDQLGPPYAVGDTVGLSGIELEYEARLAGRPSGTVDVVDDKGTVVRSVQNFAGVDPQPVQLTLDRETQLAADDALRDLTQPAALVAVDAKTGQLRAVVSTPSDTEFNRALNGQYPPGSTFKVVTASALLANGKTADTEAPCPPTLDIGGRTFTNFEGEAAGSIPLQQAFAISCNTAFIGLADQLPPTALVDAGTAFGFGAPTGNVAVPIAGGAFPAPSDDVERAAAAIGQARITASPAQMATVAATVASGQWRPPVLVSPPADTADRSALPSPPSPDVLDTLRSMMRSVVTDGTGTTADVPDQQIAGKTGTAEFGTGTPPTTHAWFIGYRGDLAFAVLVEGGGVGGEAAAPIAARFLRAVP